MPNAINSGALTGEKGNSRVVNAWLGNFQYARTGATKIFSPSSPVSPFSVIVQQTGALLSMFLTSSYLFTLTSSSRETDDKAMFVYICLMPN